MRVAIYVRVSTQEQKLHGLSVDNQINALTNYCKDKGYTVYNIYNDAGISAHASYRKRPALLKLIDDCKNNRIDLILFTRIDRWFRSVKDYYLVLDQLNGVPWRAIWEDYDTTTSEGQLRVNIMLSISEAEAARTSEKVRAVLQYKKEMGLYHGSVPFGYRLIDGHLHIVPELQPMFDEIYDTYIQTRSSKAVSMILFRNGFNISISGVKRILGSTTYYGDAQGIPCEAYITKEKYNQVQSVKIMWTKSRSCPPQIFKGLCVCRICGRRLDLSITRNSYGTYTRHMCRGWDSLVKHDYFSISEIKLEKHLLSAIEDEMEKYSVTMESMTNKANDNKKAIASLEKKLERIGIRYEDGDISTEEYRRKRKAIKDEIADLSVSIPEEPPKLPDGWRNVYADLSIEGKNKFWCSIIRSMSFQSKDVKDVIIEWM